jgi:hypothetical protein
MISNPFFIPVSGFLFFVLFALVGALLSLFLDDWALTRGPGRGVRRLAKALITLIITAILTLLIFWTNVRLSGPISWLGEGTGANPSSGTSPTLDIDS